MKSETQLKVQAYLDNELSAGEARKIASQISSDPQAHALLSELEQTRKLLLENEPVYRLDESREFYWSKIQRAIDAAERVPAPRRSSSWWLRLAAPVAGTVALFALLLSVMDRGTAPLSDPKSTAAVVRSLSEIQHAPEVTAITFRSDIEGVTVVWVSTE